MVEHSTAPWTDDEVDSLNAYQSAGFVHPFTGPAGGDLIATKDGWIEEPGGVVVQSWAHPWMANWRWNDLPTPTTEAEFLVRFRRNQRLSGRGLETRVHMPCAFCAAPDFIVYRIVEVESIMTKGAVCRECKRGLRAHYRHAVGMTTFGLVQTSGDPPPPWANAYPMEDET